MGLMKKSNGRSKPYWMLVLHRFLRLMPMYISTMLFYWFVISSIGSGPMFFRFKEEHISHCEKYWFSHFLFFNNFYPLDGNNQCMGWTWYLPNDMQFFVISPPIIILLYHRRKLGLAILFFIQFACSAFNFYIVTVKKFNPAYARTGDDYYSVYYMKPWNRIFPYSVGLITALFLYSHNNEHADQSNFKRITNIIDRSRCVRWFMYATGSIGCIFLILIMYPINNWPDDVPQFWSSMYLTFTKGFFVICMVLIIFPALLGHGKLVKLVLGFDFFIPLARLTFGTYMIHAIFMQHEMFNTPRGRWMSFSTSMLYTICWMVVSYFMSFIFTILFETPCINLEKHFLTGGGKKKRRREPKPK